MKRLVLAFALTLLAGTAGAVDLGIGWGTSSSGAQSQVASGVAGGSVAAIAGISGQGSTASAGNVSFGATQLTGNNTAAQSGTIGSASQNGGSFALGGALAGNQGAAAQQGLGEGINNMNFVYLFASP